MKPTRKIILLSLTFALTLYFTLFLFPQLIFSKKIDYKSFTVYSHSNLDKNIFTVLDNADSLIRQSELFSKNSGKKKIFFCATFSEYSFFAPTQKNAFACTNPLTNNILLSKCSVQLNKIRRNGNENSIRTLSGTIAHEVTHILIKNNIGFFKNIHLDSWKKEGYCDFIANESSFEPKVGIRILCNNKNISSASFDYFKYRLYITYLIKDRHLSFKQIVHDKFNLGSLNKELEKIYCQ